MISQYANSERFKRLVDSLRSAFNNAKTFKDWYDIAFNIKTAKGYGLDIWGAILNQSRNFINKEPGDGSWYAWGNYYTRSETPNVGDRIYNRDKSETGFLVSAVSGNNISYKPYYSITIKNVGNYSFTTAQQLFITQDLYGNYFNSKLSAGSSMTFYFDVGTKISFGNAFPTGSAKIEYLNSSNDDLIKNRTNIGDYVANDFIMPAENLYIEVKWTFQ